MLQSTESQRVGHDLATEQQQWVEAGGVLRYLIEKTYTAVKELLANVWTSKGEGVNGKNLEIGVEIHTPLC